MAPSPPASSPAIRRKPWSIASRLLLAAIACGVLLLLIAGVILSSVYRRASEEAFDARLGVYLRAIVADVVDAAAPGEDPRAVPVQLGDPQFALTLSGWYWQITRLDSAKADIKASRSLFASQLPRLVDQGVPIGPGGSRRGYAPGPDGKPIRIVERQIDLGEAGVYLVQVAATPDEVEDQIWQFELALVIAFSLLALALAGTTVVQVRYGLQPLRRLGEQVAAIRRGDAERIEGSWSEDLSPLAGELNLLISSNREILERARTQVGNLAHALKTPLSVIANEARATGGPLAAKVDEQAAIMRDQVTWHLDRARAAARSLAAGAATDIAPAVGALARTFEKIYADRGVTFSVAIPDGVRFRGEKQDFEEMVGNLVDNAGKWAGGRVDIRSEALTNAADGRSMIDLVIDDDGPGLRESQRAEALARGRRLDESKPGSGLGLSIVTDLASLHRGALMLEDSPTGGLRARLRLPSV